MKKRASIKKRGILSLLFAVTLLFALTSPAIAAEPAIIHYDSFNEYDYIQLLQNSSAQELKKMGVSEQEATTIISSFEAALLERSSLCDTELRAYGYDETEIILFHKLSNGQKLSDAELRSLGSTCTGSITRYYCYLKSAKFSYTFEWNRCPLITLSDSAAMRWIAYNASDNEIGVERTSYSMLIEYHFQGNAASSGPAFAHYGQGSNQPNLDFNTLNMQFPVYDTHYSNSSGTIFDCYARKGTVTVSIKVPTGVTANIHHIFVGGLYGHTLIGIGSPTVSVSQGSIGISFTGNTSIDSIASRQATIYQASSSVEYWN